MKIDTNKSKKNTGAKAISSLLNDNNEDKEIVSKKKPRKRIQESIYFYDEDIITLESIQKELEINQRKRRKKVTKAKIAQALILYMLDNKEEKELHEIVKNYINV